MMYYDLLPEEYEKAMLEFLSNPITEPKYKLWQHTEQGQIVGFHYESFAYCIIGHGADYSGFPGWRYHLQGRFKDGDLKEIEECEERHIKLLPDQSANSARSK